MSINYYWDEFYNSQQAKKVHSASSFAVLVDAFLNKKNTNIIEFGCGNFRDSLFFVQNGYNVTALDKANVVNLIPDSRIEFIQTDLEQNSPSAIVESKFKEDDEFINCVYSRFFLHSINEKAQVEFIRDLINSSNVDLICSEFRTLKDASLPKVFGTEHDRFYVDYDAIRKMFHASGKFEEILAIEDQNLSIYGDENPYIGRLIYRRI